MADSAEEPLMRPRNEDNDADADFGDVSLLLEKNLRHPGVYVWLLTFSAGISGLLFGYDTGVISATLVSINSSLGHPLTTLDKSLITSCTSLFALLLLPFSSILADSLGRKSVVLFADFAFILGAVIQAATYSVWGMIAGRSIVGLAVGAGSFVVPLYISEVAPSPFRGRLVTLNVLFVTLGQVVAYVVGWAFVQWGDTLTGWRWMVGLGALPAAVQLAVMVVMPETPRWLVQVGRKDEARNVLNKIFGKGMDVQKMVDGVLRRIELEVREEEAKIGRQRNNPTKGEASWLVGAKDNWTELFRVGGNRRALAIACLLQGLQQLCGFNALMYFSATIFSILGFENPTLASLSVALTNFFMTCVAFGLIDRIGKRRILLWSVPIMAFGLILCSGGFYFITLPSDLNKIDNPSSTPEAYEMVPLSQRYASLCVLTSVMVYVGAYALGLGNVPWMQSELFPLNVRSIGSGISTATNWGANFIVGLTFLPMMEFFTPSWTFVIYALICVAGWVCIWRMYPETRGMSLEETGALLAQGWGVKESLRRLE